MRLRAGQVEVSRSDEFQRLAQLLINNMYLSPQQQQQQQQQQQRTTLRQRRPSNDSSVGPCMTSHRRALLCSNRIITSLW